MSYFTPKPATALRGRPKGSGFIKKPENKSTIPARLSPDLWAFIQSHRRINESISDTIFRMLREANLSKIEYRKKADALEERLTEVESQYNMALRSLINPRNDKS